MPVFGAAIGGTLGGIVRGMGAEGPIDGLRGFLTRPGIELFLDPAKQLNDDFFEGLTKAAERKHIVLLLVTYEQMTVVEEWVDELIQKNDCSILTVIAGRKIPDWNRILAKLDDQCPGRRA